MRSQTAPIYQMRMRSAIQHITDFRQWREQCGSTIGVTKQMASFLDRGLEREARAARQTTRTVMTAAALGVNLEPWTMPACTEGSKDAVY